MRESCILPPDLADKSWKYRRAASRWEDQTTNDFEGALISTINLCRPDIFAQLLPMSHYKFWNTATMNEYLDAFKYRVSGKALSFLLYGYILK